MQSRQQVQAARWHWRRVQGIALVLRATPAGEVVLPRRIGVALSPGAGALRIEGPPVDEACAASLSNAWAAAQRLAGRRDADAVLRVAGPAPLAGGSAGLPAGLLFLACLAGEPEPRCFATGHVADADGRLEGGLHARAKAEAAATLAADLGWSDALFLSPPVDEPPSVPGLRVACARDLAEAWRILRG